MHQPQASPQLLRKLSNASNATKNQTKFIHKLTKGHAERRVAKTIASFLPTGLLQQLDSAVKHAEINPRRPKERPGVYLCCSLSGLHTLTALPMESRDFEDALRRAFDVLATTVHETGGELIRSTADCALAVWPVPLIDGESAEDERTSDASLDGAAPSAAADGDDDAAPSAADSAATPHSFPPHELHMAVVAASTCARRLLAKLHGLVMWTAEAPSPSLKLSSEASISPPSKKASPAPSAKPQLPPPPLTLPPASSSPPPPSPPPSPPPVDMPPPPVDVPPDDQTLSPAAYPPSEDSKKSSPTVSLASGSPGRGSPRLWGAAKRGVRWTKEDQSAEAAETGAGSGFRLSKREVKRQSVATAGVADVASLANRACKEGGIAFRVHAACALTLAGAPTSCAVMSLLQPPTPLAVCAVASVRPFCGVVNMGRAHTRAQ
jgi:class 3 adenylate cyclase